MLLRAVRKTFAFNSINFHYSLVPFMLSFLFFIVSPTKVHTPAALFVINARAVTRLIR
jgi:nitrate reductase gamma subunit